MSFPPPKQEMLPSYEQSTNEDLQSCSSCCCYSACSPCILCCLLSEIILTPVSIFCCITYRNETFHCFNCSCCDAWATDHCEYDTCLTTKWWLRRVDKLSIACAACIKEPKQRTETEHKVLANFCVYESLTCCRGFRQYIKLMGEKYC